MGDRDAVRDRISKNRLSHVWMIYQLHLAGIETDKSEFSSALAGTRKGEKIDSIILMANTILDDYEQYFVKRPVTGKPCCE